MTATAVAVHADTVDTNPLNHEPEVRAAFDRFYLMDYDGALTRFEAIEAAHPQDAIATDYVLNAVLFRELFRLDLLDTTFYANDGFLTGKHTVAEDPKVRDQVKQLAQKAIGQADDVLKTKPDDVNALFARAWARSLEATYLAMVERGFGAGMKLALGAKNDDEQVLKLDPNYVDAKMVVGIYQYVVGALPFGFKIIVGFAGIHGSKTTGMEMLHDAGSRGVITSVESRTAMTLFLRREAKYTDAYAMAKGLADQYPRDFLFNLEEANLLKDAGQWRQAIDQYHVVIADAKKPDYFPSSHLELAYFGLGETQRGQKFFPDAVVSYQAAAAEPGVSPELKRRCLLEAGMVYDLMSQRDRAKQEYQAVIDEGGDSVQADQARKYEHSAYTGH
ncbi:tetratricopeptide repeat protein [Silvibacterium sp.]|uniref:tetratricopeptide repeat protein n=1 Tax=Silvibacterium sp. TaxID=1964179 RepID=UPI0039E3F8E1